MIRLPPREENDEAGGKEKGQNDIENPALIDSFCIEKK